MRGDDQVAGDAGDAAEIPCKQLRTGPTTELDADVAVVDAGPGRAGHAFEAFGQLAAAALPSVACTRPIPDQPYCWQSKPVCASICQTQQAGRLRVVEDRQAGVAAPGYGIAVRVDLGEVREPGEAGESGLAAIHNWPPMVVRFSSPSRSSSPGSWNS